MGEVVAKKTKTNGGPAPVPELVVPKHATLPRLRPIERVYPDGPLGDPTVMLRNPSIVVRVDGRYGVARTMTKDEAPRKWWDHRDGYVAGLDSSCSTGLFHEPTTYATRAEAEARAWKLARELGDTRDWP